MGVVTKYRLLAIDVDGTLVAPDDVVPADLSAAVRRAHEAGIAVVLATGRSHAEAVDVWRQLGLPTEAALMNVVGGAKVCECDSGRTLFQRVIAPEAMTAFGEALRRRGRSAIAFVDGWRWGVDYYVAPGEDAHDVSERWFGQMDVRVREVPELTAAHGVPAPLRINAICSEEEAESLAAELREEMADHVDLHAILAPNYGVTIVEAFAKGVTKWMALQYVAQGRRIGRGSIVAVGDDVNDLVMISEAGLGVAVPRATQRVLEAADMVAENGLAAMIDDLVAGRLD
ncbi:MAG: HAD hydrolase family protein [Phycisphaerae bacterium]